MSLKISHNTIFAIYIFLFASSFTLFNFFVSETIQLSHISFALFIFGGLLAVRNISIKGISSLTICLLLISLGSLRGYEYSWFFGDSLKMILLLGGIFIYTKMLKSNHNIAILIRTYSLLFIATVVVSLVTERQAVLDGYRLVIPKFAHGAGEVGWAAAALLVLYAATIELYNKYNRFDYFIIALLMIILILSVSRTSLLFVFIYLLLCQNRKRIKQYLTLFFMTTGLIGLLAILVFPIEFLTEIMYDRSTSTTGRTDIWSSFIEQFINGTSWDVLLGRGIGGGTIEIDSANFFARDPHNLFIDYVTIFGLVGCIVSISVLITYLPILCRRDNKEGRAIFAALIVAGLFNSYWRLSSLLWLNSLLFSMPFKYYEFRKSNRELN